MNDFWLNLIQQTQQVSPPFDNENNAYLMPLEDLAVIEVSGDDASSFLQNLLTNDVHSLALDQSQYTGFCNPKGRLFALFYLIRRQDSYQLVLPKSIVPSLQQKLTMYVLRSKVTITDQSDNLVCIGLSQLSNELDKTIQPITINVPGNQLCLLIVDHALIESTYEQSLKAYYQLAPSSLWESLNIDAGIAKVTTDTQEKFTPQQLNLDLNNGVSFKKGCYPGQEVVARLHYLGNPSRRLFIAQALCNELPAIGSEIKTTEGSVAGHVVNAVLQNHDNIKLLASLKLSESQKDLVVNDNCQLVITLEPEEAD